MELVELHLDELSVRGLSNVLLALAHLERRAEPFVPVALRVSKALAQRMRGESSNAQEKGLEMGDLGRLSSILV